MPSISVQLPGEVLGQGDWVGPEIRIDIERPSTGDSYTTVYDIGTPSPDEWHFGLYGIWDVQPGDEFLVTDLGESANVKFHRVYDFSIASVDKATATVSGWAEPGTELSVKTITPVECNGTVVAHELTGDWTYQFASGCMPEPVGSYGHVSVQDADDLDSSFIVWNTNNIQISADQFLEKVSGNGWKNGSVVNVTVSRNPSGGLVEVHADSATVDNGQGFELQFEGFDLQTGDLVVANGLAPVGYETSVDATVTGLTLAPEGPAEYVATVDGATGGDRWLVAQAWGENGSWAWRIQHGVIGTTTFDFTEAGKVDPDDDSFLTAPMSGLNVDEWEPDGEGSTRVEWFADAGGSDPWFWFTVEPPNRVFGNGEQWPLGATVDLTVDDLGGGDPFTDSTQVEAIGSESGEVGFQFDLNGQLDLEPGYVVTITSDFDGDGLLDVEKTLSVAEIGEITINPESGEVTGFVEPQALVNVNGRNELGEAWRDIQADETGFFTANLAVPVGPGEIGDGTLSVPFPDGTGGSVQVLEDDGDATQRGWCIACGGDGETPSAVASVWPDVYVRGWGWQGADLLITLDKTPLDIKRSVGFGT